MTAPAVHVRGPLVDEQTRCVHYQTERDVIAIQFACCGRWYACLHCHAACEEHPIIAWSVAARDARAILCGGCGSRLSIDAYCGAPACPQCAIPFNPGCAAHYLTYFEPPHHG